jgi:hypothetical protein
MSDYAHVPGGSLKFKGTGEKYVLLRKADCDSTDGSGRRRRSRIPLLNEPESAPRFDSPRRKIRARLEMIERIVMRSLSRPLRLEREGR